MLRQCLVGVSASGAAAAAERVVGKSLGEGGEDATKKMKEGMKRGTDKKSKREAKQRKAL